MPSPKRNANADPVELGGRLPLQEKRATRAPCGFAGVMVTACWQQESWRNTGSPIRWGGSPQPLARESGGGSSRVAGRPVVVRRRLIPAEPRGISDGAMLKLLKQWLEMPIEESGQGGKRRSNPARKWRRGTPQGAPISPLLANLYMRRFILGWKTLGYAEQLRSHIVNYADDFVILCRGTGVEALGAMRKIMKRVELTVNEEKTRLCRIPEESFEFLGYTIGRCYSPRTGKAYLGTKPSKEKIQRVNRRISEMTRANTRWRETGQIVTAINRQLRGWGHYFRQLLQPSHFSGPFDAGEGFPNVDKAANWFFSEIGRRRPTEKTGFARLKSGRVVPFLIEI